MVEFYSILFAACMQALIPNPHTINMQLPPHQQMYVIKGAMGACRRELATQRILACAEDPDFCVDNEEE